MAMAVAIVKYKQRSSGTRTLDRQQCSIINNNVNTFSINIFVTMTSSLQVQPEHHSSNICNRNAIQQWWQ